MVRFRVLVLGSGYMVFGSGWVHGVRFEVFICVWGGRACGLSKDGAEKLSNDTALRVLIDGNFAFAVFEGSCDQTFVRSI